MIIRKAVGSDIPSLVALNRAVQELHADALPGRFRHDAPDDLVSRAFETMIQAPSAYWLLAETERPIGFLNAEFRERPESWCAVAHRVCYLGGIVVAREFRRKGIARALLTELKREAGARGVSAVELDVWAFNEEARRAFTDLGFTRLTERMILPVELPNQMLAPMSPLPEM